MEGLNESDFQEERKRIATAMALLSSIKDHQEKDGAPALPPDMMQEFGSYINLLCEAGLLRKIDVPENALPYRITWKGLCFIDTAKWQQKLSEHYAFESVPGIVAWSCLVSFH